MTERQNQRADAVTAHAHVHATCWPLAPDETDAFGMQLQLKAITAKVLDVSWVVSGGTPRGGGE